MNVGEQRIYHMTHIKNLPGILSGGILQAHSSEAGRPTLVVDIAAPDTRETRRTTELTEQEDSVARYVPFFLSPDARLWDSIRSGESDPRLAAEVAGFASTEFVVLVSTIKDVFAHADSVEQVEYSITNGDAAGVLTRFGTGREGVERMVRGLRANEESEEILDAEFLVKEAFPFELVSLIGVKNERVRDEVKSLLAHSSQRARVAVYPPWFQPSGVNAP